MALTALLDDFLRGDLSITEKPIVCMTVSDVLWFLIVFFPEKGRSMACLSREIRKNTSIYQLYKTKRYDKDGSGELSLAEASLIFQDLGLQPKTKVNCEKSAESPI